MKKRHIGLYEGIGGFSLAAEKLDYETVAWCEWSAFCQRVLKYHFPNAKSFGDITTSDFSEYEGSIDLLTAGFPCQPFSVAGNRKGTEDDRYGWPATRRAIEQIKPNVIILENVAGLASILEPTCTTRMERQTPLLFEEGYDSTIVEERKRVLGIILTQLQSEGYVLPECEDGTPIVLCIPASSTNAPHERYRYWIVGFRRDYINGLVGNPQHNGYASAQRRREVTKPRRPKEQNTFGESTRANSLQPSNATDSNNRRPKNQSKRESRVHPAVNAPDANSIRRREQLQQPRSNGAGTRKKFSRGSQNNDGDANGTRWTKLHVAPEPSGEEHTGRRDYGNEPREWFVDFPTQSPICGRNDGFPSKLVGITVSSHRNESIKAYGNAIVHYVAMQIIKSIDVFTETIKNT